MFLVVQSKLISDIERLDSGFASLKVTSDTVQAILIPNLDKMELDFASLKQNVDSLHTRLTDVEECAACNATVRRGQDLNTFIYVSHTNICMKSI